MKPGHPILYTALLVVFTACSPDQTLSEASGQADGGSAPHAAAAEAAKTLPPATEPEPQLQSPGSPSPQQPLPSLQTTPLQTTPLPTNAVLATTDFDDPAITVELTEATRRDGVLTVKVRFVATRDTAAFRSVYLDRKLIDDDFYVTASDKKYFILRDEEGNPLTPDKLIVKAQATGDQTRWWAKFPAPPAEVKSFSLSMAQLAPFDGIPITDL